MNYKRKGYRIGLLLYLLGWLIGCFWVAGLLRSGRFTHMLGVHLSAVEPYTYFALAGAIGGTLYSLRLFHEFYDTMSERWILWYLVRPIKCGVAAVMTIVLFESGIMLLQTGNTLSAKIGIAFLVGFGYGKLMQKLRTLTEALFSESREHPSLPASEDKRVEQDNK
jgi:hypothetical protein